MRVPVFRSVAMGLFILLLGAGSMVLLMRFKAPPAHVSAEQEEKAVAVETLAVSLTSVPVSIAGFGEASSLREVTLAAEVPGTILSVHPDLNAGMALAAGAVLFEIDPRPFDAALEDARAQVARAEQAIERLKGEQERDQARLSALDRSLALTRKQHERAKSLMNEGIGAPREVEQAEQTLVSAQQDRRDASSAVDLYPIRIREMAQELASAEARRELARLDRERCTVRAPFDLRVKTRHIDAGETVAAGSAAVTVADDSALEIVVALDSRDASLWLPFEEGAPRNGKSWFAQVRNVPCEVTWTERPDAPPWQGRLHRVEAFDQNTRTLRVAVRVDADQPENTPDFPLVEGMFCQVNIPGTRLENVFALPQTAVTLEDNVYLVEERRLKTRAVTVARVQDGVAYVSEGLSPGEEVIVTRLVNPLDNTLLETRPHDTEAS